MWDVDGNEYIDYQMARGPLVLGHDYPAVREAVEERLGDGTTYTLPHELEIEVADAITDVVPCAEMVRFAKNGNDVTAAAAKLARAYTGRDVIATQGYHGWPDVWAGDTGRDRGVPDAVGTLTESFRYNDVESVERVFEDHPDDVAAIVTTPMDTIPPEDGFLERLREIADREGALLVFDEVVTGFRFAVGGAQEYFDVTPDLGCFAKGMANGYPLAALAGREDVMRTIERDDFVFSLTYGGETVSLAAAKAAIRVLREEPVIDRIFERGRALREGYEAVAEAVGMSDATACRGLPPFLSVTFDVAGDAPAKSLFMQECVERGVLFDGTHLVSYSHTEQDVEYTLEVYREALESLSDAVEQDAVEDRLEGRPIGAPLRDD